MIRVSSGVGSGSPTRPASTRTAVSAARPIGVSSATSRGSSSGSTVSVTASSFAVAVPLRSSGLAGVSAGAPGAPSVSRETSGDASRDRAGRIGGAGSRDPRAAGRPQVLGAAPAARPAAPSSSEPRGSGPVFHVKHRPAVARPSRRPRRLVGASARRHDASRPRSSRRPRLLVDRRRPRRPPARHRVCLGRPVVRPAETGPGGLVGRRRRAGRRAEHADGPLEMTSSSGQPSPDDLIAPASSTTVHRRSVADEQLLEPGRGCRRPYAAGRSRGQAAGPPVGRNPVTSRLTRRPGRPLTRAGTDVGAASANDHGTVITRATATIHRGRPPTITEP